ncbi:hypothetical protein SLS53_002926 [Cytospora paraplurivora]|uniref:Uncharacterized protein n=1 Tax=Cytospora paraplurivora TaxID=2898453 RepID=A0AAN9YHT2_9PEZI
MEAPKDCNMESINVVDTNYAKDEKPSEATAVLESESQPKLPDEMEKWSREWHEAQATAASDLPNHVLSPILRFLTKRGLPPYYKLKALIFCSAAYQEDESQTDLESRRYFLEKAQAALQRCEYTHPEDCKEVRKIKKCLEEEWQSLLEAEAAAKGDSDGDQAEQ